MSASRPSITIENRYKPTRGRFVLEQIPKHYKVIQLGSNQVGILLEHRRNTKKQTVLKSPKVNDVGKKQGKVPNSSANEATKLSPHQAHLAKYYKMKLVRGHLSQLLMIQEGGK